MRNHASLLLPISKNSDDSILFQKDPESSRTRQNRYKREHVYSVAKFSHRQDKEYFVRFSSPEFVLNSNMPAVGIDLGTTYSCVGVFQHGKVEIISNDQGNRTTPSYVAFTESERLIGDSAKNQVALNPSNTVFGEFSVMSKCDQR